MSDADSSFKKQKIPNPCVNLCSLNNNNVCIGCYRTIDEVGAWGRYDDEQRLQVLKNCEHRFQEMLESDN